MNQKTIINATVFDFETFATDSFIRFDETIMEVGKMKDYRAGDDEVIDASGHLVMPGLIVGHTHIYSTFARGLSVPFNPKNFQDILEQLWWKLDRHLDLEMTNMSALVSAVDHVKNGVTTLIDHHASGVDITGTLASLQAAVTGEVGLRGAFAFEVSDRFDVNKAILENVTFMDQHEDAWSRGLFGLHASMSLSDETLKQVKHVLGNAPIHIHVAESELDQEDCLKRYGVRIIHRLHRHGLLNPGSILAHCIYLDEEELDIIKQQRCVIAVNVTSNMNNSVGLPGLTAFRKKGIPVIIGNDGISSSVTTEYLYAYYATHLLDKTPNHFGLDDLRHIILDTYQYVSALFDIPIGKIEFGYASDLLIVPYDPPTPLDETNVMGHLFFGLFNSFKPRHVFVGGKQLVNGYEVNQSLQQRYREASQTAARLWKNIHKEV